jgi:hypothetical protein
MAIAGKKFEFEIIFFKQFRDFCSLSRASSISFHKELPYRVVRRTVIPDTTQHNLVVQNGQNGSLAGDLKVELSYPIRHRKFWEFENGLPGNDRRQ